MKREKAELFFPSEAEVFTRQVTIIGNNLPAAPAARSVPREIIGGRRGPWITWLRNTCGRQKKEFIHRERRLALHMGQLT